MKGTFSEKVMWQAALDGGGQADRTGEGQGDLELILHSDHTVIGDGPGIIDDALPSEDQKPAWKGIWCISEKPAAKP